MDETGSIKRLGGAVRPWSLIFVSSFNVGVGENWASSPLGLASTGESWLAGVAASWKECDLSGSGPDSRRAEEPGHWQAFPVSRQREHAGRRSSHFLC